MAGFNGVNRNRGKGRAITVIVIGIREEIGIGIREEIGIGIREEIGIVI